MEGLHVDEKEYFLSEEIKLSTKDNNGEHHSCGQGRFMLTNKRIQFSNSFGTWEENLDTIGICAISKNLSEYESPCILCQINSTENSYNWIIYPQDSVQIEDLYNLIINCLDKLEN